MQQRDIILQAWERRRALIADTPGRRKADAFFAMVRTQLDICWQELADEFRRNYYDAFDEIIPVLLATDDPLIIYNCVRFADLKSPKEMAALEHVVRGCDSAKHQVTMRTLAETQAEGLLQALREKRDLPQAVRAALRPPQD